MVADAILDRMGDGVRATTIPPSSQGHAREQL
jgi:hypothetical protein